MRQRSLVSAVLLAGLAIGCGQSRPEPTPAEPVTADAPDEALPAISVPDVVLLDQRGQPVHLYTDLVKGKSVAMSFIFTRCTTICPPIGSNFARLQRRLGERAGKEVSLISISIDPENDTPEQLRAWGERHGAGPGWTLLTGKKEDVDRVLRAMTVYTAAKEEHSPIVLVGDDVSGEWTRAHGLSSPDALFDAVERAQAARRARVAPAPAPAPAGAAVSIPAGDRGAARYFGDTVLVDQDGERLRFYSDLIRGKKVVINVFFSSCGATCPVMARALGRVQESLGDRLGEDVNMLSITVDPEHDTPAKLREYAARVHARRGWRFLTGKKEDVQSVLHKLGQDTRDPSDHASLVFVGNEPTGLWKKAFGLAAPEDLVSVISSVVDDRAEAHGR